jgi:recombination protein RecA
MPTVDEVLANIDSKLRKRMKNGEGWRVERQALPSIGLTDALGGGFGYGRIVTVHGSKSAGKTSMLLQMLAAAQKDGKSCAWIDAEKAFDTSWAERLGVDCSNLILTRASDMARAGDEIVGLIKAGIELVILDSISALVQPSYLDKDSGELKGMDATHKIGDFSSGIKGLIKSVNYVNDKTLVVLISQQTTLIASNYTKQIPEGGKAIEFYSSQVVKLNSPPSRTISKTNKSGNRSFEQVVGREVDWTIDYNKLGAAGGTGTYEFYFLGDSVGVDPRLELLDAAIMAGVIIKGGAWYNYRLGEEDHEKYHGAANVVEWLSNKDVFDKIKKDCEES